MKPPASTGPGAVPPAPPSTYTSPPTAEIVKAAGLSAQAGQEIEGAMLLALHKAQQALVDCETAIWQAVQAGLDEAQSVIDQTGDKVDLPLLGLIGAAAGMWADMGGAPCDVAELEERAGLLPAPGPGLPGLPPVPPAVPPFQPPIWPLPGGPGGLPGVPGFGPVPPGYQLPPLGPPAGPPAGGVGPPGFVPPGGFRPPGVGPGGPGGGPGGPGGFFPPGAGPGGGIPGPGGPAILPPIGPPAGLGGGPGAGPGPGGGSGPGPTGGEGGPATDLGGPTSGGPPVVGPPFTPPFGPPVPPGGGAGAGGGGTGGGPGPAVVISGPGGNVVVNLACPPPAVNLTCPPPVINVTGGAGGAGGAGGEGGEGGAGGAGGAGAGGGGITTSAEGPTGDRRVGVLGAGDEKPEEGPSVLGVKIDWTKASACLDVRQLGDAVGGWAGCWLDWLADKESDRADCEGRISDKWKDLDGFQQFIASHLAWPVTGLARMIQSVNGSLSGLGGCNNPGYQLIVAARGLLAATERWVGFDYHEAHQYLDYAAQSLCPVEIPELGAVNDLWRRGWIDDELWLCWIKAHGQLPEPARDVRDMGITRLSPSEAITAWHRGYLDETQAVFYQVKAGMALQGDRDLQRELARFWPSTGDLIRFMTRDVFDNAVVRAYGYDDEFAVKATPTVLDLAKGNGLSQTDLLWFWRAHWRLPGEHQAVDMLHRLRPGRVAADLVTTQADVDKLLDIADVLPFWRKRILAIAYPPLPRRELRRAYFLGTIDDADLLERLQDLGSSLTTARVQVVNWQAERLDWLRNRWEARYYVQGTATRGETIGALTRLGVSDALQATTFGMLDSMRKEQFRRACTTAIKKRFILGEFDRYRAQDLLFAQGHTNDDTIQMVDSWVCEAQARSRDQSAGTLVRWASEGIIPVAILTARLLRLGYLPGDIQAMVAEAQLRQAQKLQQAQQKAAQAQQKQQQAQQKAAQAQATKQQRQATAAAKQATTAERAREKVIKTEAAAEAKAAKQSGNDRAHERGRILTLFGILTTPKGFSDQGAYDLILELIKDASGKGAPDWWQPAHDFINALPDRPRAPQPVRTGRPGRPGKGPTTATAGNGQKG